MKGLIYKKDFQIEVIELPKYTACRKGEFKEREREFKSLYGICV